MASYPRSPEPARPVSETVQPKRLNSISPRGIAIVDNSILFADFDNHVVRSVPVPFSPTSRTRISD